MFVLRCTKKLLSRLGNTTWRETASPASSTRLGDWYANFVIVNRQHLVLAASSITLLPVVLPAAPFKTLPSRLTEGVAEMLHALGVERGKIASENDAMAECIVSTTKSRQILGSMNDFQNMLSFYLDGSSPFEAALKLAEAPCSPLKMESPRSATLTIFAQAESQRKRSPLQLVK